MQRFFILFWRLVYFTVSALLILAIVYLFGHLALEKTVGNDGSLAFSYTAWIDKYFPNIPRWYPLAGGGTSIVIGYNLLSSYVIVLFKQLTKVNLYESFIFFQFLPLFLTPLAIYFYCFFRLKNQTLGLIAAVFYTLSPLTWSWLFDWGFYSQAFSVPFYVLGFLLFDWFWENFCRDHHSRKTKFGLLIFGLLFTLTLLAHVTSGIALLLSTTLYVILDSLIVKGISFGKTVTGLFLVVTVALSFSAFYLFPFLRYSSIAGQDGLNRVAPETLKERFDAKTVFQITKIGSQAYMDNPHFVLRNISMPLLVSGLAVFATILSIFKNKKIFILAIVAWGGAVNLVFPNPKMFVAEKLPVFVTAFNDRSWLTTMSFLFPVLAAYALFALVQMFIDLVSFWSKKVNNILSFFIPLMTVGLAVILAYSLRNISIADEYKDELVNYGYSYGTMSAMNLKDVWQDPNNICVRYEYDIKNPPSGCPTFFGQLQLDKWPVFLPASASSWKKPDEAKLFSQLPETENGLYRIDLSPRLGGLSEKVSLYTQASQINSYTFQLSLIHRMWGYMQGLMYSNDLDDRPSVINELAGWFGLNKVFLWDGPGVHDKYRMAGWSNSLTVDNGIHGLLQIFDNPLQLSLAEISDKPAILVIGDPKLAIFDNIFRIAVGGALAYDRANLIVGKKNIDDYKLSDLKKFKLVLLHGYSYTDRDKAFDLLDRYLKDGGSLFMNTGWQYSVPDYQIENAPAFFPAEKLFWTNLDEGNKYSLNSDIVKGLNPDKFSPLVWEGRPWGVSSLGEKKVLRPWVKPVLSIGETPLVTIGEYKSGRVVWTGVNLFAHSLIYKNDEEAALVGWLFDYLLGQKDYLRVPVRLVRRYPDIVEISLEEDLPKGGSLYFREAVFPDWKASVVTGKTKVKLTIDKAGPGFIFVSLPKLDKDDVVKLEVRAGMLDYFAAFVSIAGVSVVGLTWMGMVNPAGVLRRLTDWLRSVIWKRKQSWDHDEND